MNVTKYLIERVCSGDPSYVCPFTDLTKKIPIFLMTDDENIILKLANYPEFEWFYFRTDRHNTSEADHFLTASQSNDKMDTFFALGTEIEIVQNSSLFIGTAG